MRQIDLSLDRSRWGPWIELKEYYYSQFNPLSVSEELLKITNITPVNTPVNFTIKEYSLFKKMKDALYRIIFKKQLLKNAEVLYSSQLLHQFDHLLHGSFSEYPIEAEQLRINIARFYSYILEPKLSNKDYFRAMEVEHFMQNENIDVVKIDLFATGLGLKLN